MMREQKLIAFIAKLTKERGVSPLSIECAIDEVLDIKLAESITGEDPMVRAFSMEQAARLERG